MEAKAALNLRLPKLFLKFKILWRVSGLNRSHLVPDTMASVVVVAVFNYLNFFYKKSITLNSMLVKAFLKDI